MLDVFDWFSDRTRDSLDRATREARRLGQDHIAPEHMLLGMLGDENCSGCKILVELGADRAQLRSDVEAAVEKVMRSDTLAQLPFADEAKRVLMLTMQETARLNRSEIRTMHLLLGLLAEAKSTAARVLVERGVGLERVRALAVLR
jgi:ATP-dependent Clp protease ATP-binding subunit ClpC